MIPKHLEEIVESKAKAESKIKTCGYRDLRMDHQHRKGFILGASFGYQLAVEEQRKILEEIVLSFESLKQLVDDDYMKSTTEDDETEYWVNNESVQEICDESIEKLKAHLEVQR